MKNFIISILGLCSLAWMFTACNKGPEDYDIEFNDIPAAQAAAGSYEGLWTRILGSTGDTIRDVPGEIIFGVDTIVHQMDSVTTSTNYFATIRFVCDSLDLDVFVDATNIAYRNDGFVFFNDNSSNGLKRSFAGLISNEGEISIAFPWTQKISGRIRKFEYSFLGLRSGD